MALGRRFPQPCDLMGFGGDGEHAGAFPVGLHAVAVDIGFHCGEVRRAESLQFVELGRPAGFAVGDAVGQAGFDETPVATGGRPAETFSLDEHHCGSRIALGRPQRRPQPGVAAANHQQVAARRPGEGRKVRTGADDGGIQPHRTRASRSQGPVDQVWVDRVIEDRPHVVHGATARAAGCQRTSRAISGPMMARMKTYGVATAARAPAPVPTRPIMTSENSPRAIKAVPARN